MDLNIVNDSSNFKVDEEKKNEVQARPPECILRLRPPNPERSNLSDKELAEAKFMIWNKRFCDLKFPRERKFRVDPPISGQSVGIISFMPAPGSLPDRQGCYGVVKLRGNFANAEDAERYGSMLMRKYDSYADYDLVRVGQEFPLMIDNSVYTEETREINIKAIVDDVSLSYIKKKKEEDRRQREEVEERHRKLVSKDTEEEKAESSNDLEFYTTLRTKRAHCLWVIDESNRKRQEAEEALLKINNEIADLDQQFPTYSKDFIAQYDRALQSVGTNAAENPLIGYMKKDIESGIPIQRTNTIEEKESCSSSSSSTTQTCTIEEICERADNEEKQPLSE